MWKEFKEFIMRGNVLDLAIGVVMGAAFTAIVNSLVDSIIMPVVTSLTGNASVEDLSVQIGSATMNYGAFIQAIIDFLIIALILFLVVKGLNNLSKRMHREEEPEEVAVPATEEYLREIRDLLQDNKIIITNEDVNKMMSEKDGQIIE